MLPAVAPVTIDHRSVSQTFPAKNTATVEGQIQRSRWKRHWQVEEAKPGMRLIFLLHSWPRYSKLNATMCKVICVALAYIEIQLAQFWLIAIYIYIKSDLMTIHSRTSFPLQQSWKPSSIATRKALHQVSNHVSSKDQLSWTGFFGLPCSIVLLQWSFHVTFSTFLNYCDFIFEGSSPMHKKTSAATFQFNSQWEPHGWSFGTTNSTSSLRNSCPRKSEA